MKYRIVPIVPILLILSFLIVSCTTVNINPNKPINVAYKTLQSMAITYDAVMRSYIDLLEKGVICEEDEDKIDKYVMEFWDKYHLAVDALEAVSIGSSAESYEDAIDAANMALTVVVRLVNEYLVEEE